MESESLEEMGVEPGFPVIFVESGSSGMDDVESGSSGMDDIESGSTGMDDKSGSPEMGDKSGSSGMDDKSGSSDMDDNSGFPSKKLKMGEEAGFEDGMEIMDLEASSSKTLEIFDYPLLSSICEMDYLHRKFDERVKFDQVTLCGKYILFCCFFLPPRDDDGYIDLSCPDDLITICSELYTLRDDFEMVVVMKMSEEDNCGVPFSMFLSQFPTYCVVVPFKESKHRDFMCNYFDLVDPGSSKFLLVNVKRNVRFLGHPENIVEHLKELSKESPFDFHRCHQMVLKKVWPVIRDEWENSRLPSGTCLIAGKFNDVKPEYPDHINRMVSESKSSCPIEIGQSLDVISLLSGKGEMNYLVRNDGERVKVERETFNGKYIMVFCFGVPVFRDGYNALVAQAIATTCSELYSTRNDFEMVVVLKMNNMANYEAVFDHFLLGFPSSCLAVPFVDPERRDFICKYLDLLESYYKKCLILDKDMDIKRNILFCGDPHFALEYGANAFPFTAEKLRELRANDYIMWKSPALSKLEGLLGCNPSDVLHRFNSAGVCEQVPVSDLNEKVVGLYYYVRGDFIPTLQEVHQQCITKQLEFEVVLVYIPGIADCLDPHICLEKIKSYLLEHKISWWWFPFNTSVSCRLRRHIYSLLDKLIIVGAHGEFVEPYGDEIMGSYGVDAYPFTIKDLIQRELDKFEGLTLKSLLVYGSRDYVYRNREKVHVAELKGKNILLYLDSLEYPHLLAKVEAWYYEIQKDNSDFDVVFVGRHKSKRLMELDDVELSAIMPWYVCPFDPDHSASLEKKIFNVDLPYDTLVEFDTNGLVCSLEAQEHLINRGPGAFPFGKSYLRQDVISYFRLHHSECMNDMV